jgi:activator of HSP90 ATPase
MAGRSPKSAEVHEIAEEFTLTGEISMTSENLDRRGFFLRSGSIATGLCLAGHAAAASDNSAATQTCVSGEISYLGASIHQAVVFAAPPERVYRTLVETELFDKVVRLSGAMNSDMRKSLGAAPTHIDAVEGGAFKLFGGYISGRNLELVPDTLIIQAWRAGSWDPGTYSIAKFELRLSGSGTRLTFDHKGFPNEAADHLARGWHSNYWEPIAKSLA